MKLVAKEIIGQEREVKCEICFNFPNFGKWKEKYILFPFVWEVKWEIKFNFSPGNYREVIKGVPTIRETVPLLTSDMGTKTPSVYAHYFLLPQRANSDYILSVICFATNFLSKNWDSIFLFHFYFLIEKVLLARVRIVKTGTHTIEMDSWYRHVLWYRHGLMA